MKRTQEAAGVPPMTPVLLLVVSAAAALLALFQWMELLVARSGGGTVCSINATVNCEAVWNSAFASRIHHYLGIPVAGLGLVWALTAFGLSVLLVYRLAAEKDLGFAIAAHRLVATVGILACITFAAASARAGAVCLTCLATYAVVAAFALVVARLLPGPLQPARQEFKPALLWSLGLALSLYLLLLGPGLKTPGSSLSLASMQRFSSARADGSSALETALEKYLQELPAAEQQAVSDSIAIYRQSPNPPTQQFPVRNRRGPADASVRFVEFTDISCVHCAQLLGVMKELERVVPIGKFSVEARNFPLDGACNPAIALTHPSTLSCLGARVQICLEGAPDFWSLRDRLFNEQASLTKDKIIEIASSGTTDRAALENCIASAETEAKLKDDIAYAMQFSPRGTPIILINGREGPPLPSFIFAMAMTEANPNSPAFAKLPPARSQLQ